MKKIFLITLISVYLSGCSVPINQTGSSVELNKGSNEMASPKSSPITEGEDVRQEIDSLTEDLDIQISELDINSDFADTTKQDFE